MKELINNLIEKTNNGLEWSVTSNKYELSCFDNDHFITLLKVDENLFRLIVWDENGQKIQIVEPDHFDMVENQILYELFDTIIKNNALLNTHFLSIKNHPNNVLVSFSKLASRLADVDDFLPELHVSNNASFRVEHEKNSLFVEPNLKQLPTSIGYTSIDEADVVLITAPGATGKSWFTQNLSQSTHAPIYDLSKEKVGSNSLLGIFYKSIGPEHLSDFILGLKKGKTSLIIDALDEGYSQVKHDSFVAFLDDIIEQGKDSQGLPFVLLGRPSIMDFTALYLEERGLKVVLLQIVPFTRKKAEEFICKRVFNNSYIPSGNEYFDNVRTRMLDSLEGFIKTPSDINNSPVENFIGYAPVLMTISKMMSRNSDYHKQLLELEKSESRNFKMLVEIVDMILSREQEKISEGIKDLLQGNPDMENILRNAYTPDEQCERLFEKISGFSHPHVLVEGDDTLNKKYEERILSFFEEHPFLDGNRFQNSVFESYVISKLVGLTAYHDEVLYYLDNLNINKESASYLLFGIYNIINENNTTEYDFLKYLYSSYISTDTSENRTTIEIVEEPSENNDGNHKCIAFISKESKDDCILRFEVPSQASLSLGGRWSNVSVDVLCDVTLDHTKTDLVCNVSINSPHISISSDELIISSAPGANNIVMSADKLTCNPKSGNIPSIKNTGGAILTIFTNSKLYYPYVNHKKTFTVNTTDDPRMLMMYQKLRRTMLLFRPCNGMLTVSKSKIDSRIAKTKEGSALIHELKSTGIIYQFRTEFYAIDYDKEADILGAKYDDLRNCIILPKIETFLQRVIDKVR